jgi:hypothetical protein
MYFCRDAGREAPFPRKGSYVIVSSEISHALIELSIYSPDVNQFSIITELLGTPPDDVIETICSENVRCNVVS